MNTRNIGNQGLKSGEIGLGCMGMSEFYGKGDDVESINVIHEAIERGVTMLDTADMYGIGENEKLVGKALAGKRDKVVLATKFGIVREEGRLDRRNINGTPEYIAKACEASLKRLNVECIDLYYMHRRDANVPIEDTVGAMAKLVQEGKVKYLGLSEVSAETLKKASAVHPISALQTEYSLWSRDIEDKIIPMCRELGTSLVAYSPLGRGFLTGSFKKFEDIPEDDFRKFSPRFSEENFQENLRMVKELEEFAKNLGYKASQLAIAWTLAKGKDIIPIPGTKRIKYLLENIEAANIKLTEEQVAKIEKIIDTTKVKGTRYPEEFMDMLNI